MRKVFLWLLALLAAVPATAQEPEEVPRNVFIPIPVIYYTPETKLALGISGAYLYRTGNAEPGSRPSMLGGVAIYTTRNQFLASVGGENYWDHDRQRISGAVAYQNFPNDFYGLGNDTDADFSEDYTDEGAAINLDYLREIRPKIHAGGGISFGSSSISDTRDGDLLDGDAVPGSGGGLITGVGVVADYDSRENVGFPLSGAFHQIGWRLYSESFGGDYDLNVATLDLRQYVHLGGKRVLALRGFANMASGDVPFQIMPMLGGDALLRGYIAGRFRERKLLAAQAEYRFTAWKRLGGAVFGGLGQVAHEYSGLGLGRFHYSGGVGLRILLLAQEQMHLRLDFGFGEDQSGFYLGFGEAF